MRPWFCSDTWYRLLSHIFACGRQDTIRLMISYAAAHGWKMSQFDVETAFLNGDLEEEIYVYPPEGYEQKDEDDQPLIWKLNKALYGLKQAPRCWYNKFSDFMKEVGMHCSTNDTALFYDPVKQLYLILWVDDGLICCPNENEIKDFETKLSSKFSMKFEDPNHFVGFQICKLTDGSIKIHQQAYCKKILHRFQNGSLLVALYLPLHVPQSI